jgi:uncharacterized protein
MNEHENEGRFAEGIQLFNRGNFFEAHEVWEQEWKTAESVQRMFYQGMIQAAVALHHIQRRNYAGAISVYLKSWPKLADFPRVWMGIELGQFRSDLKMYFAPLRTSSYVGGGNSHSVRVAEIGGFAKPPIIKWAPA